MRRVLALVAAAAMIAGALFLRSALDDRKEEKGRVYSLVCAEDLAAACDEVRDAYPGRVEVTIEPAGVTADRLVGAGDADFGLDGWLVTAPWREIVDGARRSRGKVPIFGEAPPPAIARSQLALVAWKRPSRCPRRPGARHSRGSASARRPARPEAGRRSAEGLNGAR